MQRYQPHASLFVSNTAAYTSIDDIRSYFSAYGHIVDLQTSRSSKMNKKLVKLVADPLTCSKILDGCPHVIDGRTICCKAYLQGRDLYKSNADINNRRVVVKGVPVRVTEVDLRVFIETRHGMVDTMFEFKPDNQAAYASVKYSIRKYSSYSVVFKEKYSACSFVSEGLPLHIFGPLAKVEKFKYCKRASNKNSSNTVINPLSSNKECFDVRNNYNNVDINTNHVNTQFKQEGDMPARNKLQAKALKIVGLGLRPLDHHSANVRFNVVKSC